MNLIRKWTLDDAYDLSLIMNNKRVHDNLRDGVPFPYTKSDAIEYINSLLKAPVGSQYAWAICQNGKAIGSISISPKNDIHSQTAELGYCLAEPYWGKGIMTKAVKEVCNYIFEHTDIIRIFAEPFSDNYASCRVLEKVGFMCEGVLRKNAVKNGKVKDMKMYSIIR